MHEFIWFPTEKHAPDEYHAVIPDSLFKTGKLHGLNKLPPYFAKRGINIYNVSTDTRNQAYTFSSKPQYEEKILNVKSMIITRIN